MILIATGETSPTATQQAIVFAHQLKAAGYDPVMDSASLPEDLPMASHFTATPFLRDLNDLTDLQKLVVIGAEHRDRNHTDTVFARPNRHNGGGAKP